MLDTGQKIAHLHRRRLAMSMSRAKDFLYVIVPEELPTPLTNGMRMDYWEKI